MTGMIGADVDSLLSLADSFSTAATRLNDVNDVLTAQLQTLPWVGEHADATRSRWFNSSAAVLRDSAALLHSSSQDLRRNAQEQIDASSASSTAGNLDSWREPVDNSIHYNTRYDWNLPLYNFGVQASDIGQGAIGDCWLMAPLAALASTAKGRKALEGMVQLNRNGTYTVTWLDGTKTTVSGKLPAIDLNDDGKLDVPRFAQTPGSDRWVAIIEQAAAKKAGSYQALDGGSLTRGYEILGLSNAASYYDSDTIVAPEMIEFAISQHPQSSGFPADPVTVSVNLQQGGLNSDLFKDPVYHQLAVVSYSHNDEGEMVVTLMNPWHSNEYGEDATSLRWPPGVVVLPGGRLQMTTTTLTEISRGFGTVQLP